MAKLSRGIEWLLQQQGTKPRPMQNSTIVALEGNVERKRVIEANGQRVMVLTLRRREKKT